MRQAAAAAQAAAAQAAAAQAAAVQAAAAQAAAAQAATAQAAAAHISCARHSQRQPDKGCFHNHDGDRMRGQQPQSAGTRVQGD